MTEPASPAAPSAPADERDKYRSVYKWAVTHTAGREDWDPVTLLGVMQSAKIAGVPYEELAPVLWRLAWSEDGHRDFAELRDLARRHGRAHGPGRPMTREEREELFAVARQRSEAATERFTAQRRSGPLPVLREPGRDP